MKSQSRSSKDGLAEEQVLDVNSVAVLSLTGNVTKIEFSQKEQELLQNLFEWRERSEKTRCMLGEPLSY